MGDLMTLAVMAGVINPQGTTTNCLLGSQDNRPSPFSDPVTWAKGLCGPAAEQVEVEKKLIAAPQQHTKPLFLRLCILSATELAAGDISGNSDPYVEIVFNQLSFATAVQPRTLNPVWEYILECEIKEAGVIQFKVFDRDFGRRGTFLGSCSLLIPKNSVKLKREILPLRNVPSGWFKQPPNSRLTVIWHVVDSVDSQPDLLELSKRLLDGVSSDQQTPTLYHVSVNILQSEHPREQHGMLSCVKVTIGGNDDDNKTTNNFSAFSPFGKPNGSLFIYGQKRGWRTHHTISDATYEDLLQTQLTIDWLLRKGDPSEIEALASLQETNPEVEGIVEFVSRRGSAAGDSAVVTGSAKGHVIVDVNDEDEDASSPLSAKEKLRRTRAKIKEEKRKTMLQNKIKNFPVTRLTRYGSFSITIDEIYDFCREVGVQWGANVSLTFKSIFVGTILVQVSVRSEAEPFRRQVDLFKYPPPTIKGIQKKGEGSVIRPSKGDIATYLYAYADFLPKTDFSFCALQRTSIWEFCDPFLSVTVHGLSNGAQTFTSPVISRKRREIEFPPLPILIPSDQRRQKIVFELFDSDSPIASSALANLCKTLIGEGRLSTFSTQKSQWIHFYGGAINCKRTDFDVAMIKGGVEPASTYHGSLCLVFDNKRTKKRNWPPFPEKIGHHMRLELTLFRGLYLPEKYWGKDVKILVQVAGCILSFADELGHLLEPEKHLPETAPSRNSRSMHDIPQGNSDILEFPAYINDRGVLRFHEWTRPREQLMREFEAARRRWLKIEKAKGAPPPKPLERIPDNAWVARRTPPLKILPQVEWCYVYLAMDGPDDRLDVPAIFGRFPLRYPDNFDNSSVVSAHNTWPPAAALKDLKDNPRGRRKRKDHMDPPMNMDAKRDVVSEGTTPATTKVSPEAKKNNFISQHSPEWIKLHWDQSVVELPSAKFVSDFAGVLCGQARLIFEPNHAKVLQKQTAIANLDDFSEVDFVSDSIDAFIIQRSRPLVIENAYVPEVRKSDKWFGIDFVEERRGVPGSLVYFEKATHFQSSSTITRNPSPSNMVSTFLHFDVLQARRLPALDADGLVNPHWEVLVEDQYVQMIEDEDVLPGLENVPSTFNPSFLQRSVVEFQMYCPPSLQASNFVCLPSYQTPGFVPPPPVVLKLYDLDWESDDESVDGESDDCADQDNSRKVVETDTELSLTHTIKKFVMKKKAPKKNHGCVVKELIGIVVEWDPKNLDESRIEHRLEVNSSHSPIWYSMETPETASYDELEMESAKSYAWLNKARILCCFGMSFSKGLLSEMLVLTAETNQQLGGIPAPLVRKKRKKPKLFFASKLPAIVEEEEEQQPVQYSQLSSEETKSTDDFLSDDDDDDYNKLYGSIESIEGPQSIWPVINLAASHDITGCQVNYYRFDFDILGLRQVGELGVTIPNSDLKISITSFWSSNQKIELFVSNDSLPAPNAVPTLLGSLDNKLNENFIVLGKSKPTAIPMKGTHEMMKNDGSVGTLIRSPIFATPTLDYLQGTRRKDEESRDRVILPDVTVRLMEMESGEVMGSISMSLQEFLQYPQGMHVLRLQLQHPQLREIIPPASQPYNVEIDDALAKINMLGGDEEILADAVVSSVQILKAKANDGIDVKRLVCQAESATTIFIDCFAESAGELTYDDDVVPGRIVVDHDLFFIQPHNVDTSNRRQTPEPLTHRFNSDDYFLGWQERLNSVFVQPHLRVTNVHYGGISASEYRLYYETLFGKADMVDALTKGYEGCVTGFSDFWAGVKNVANDACCGKRRTQDEQNNDGNDFVEGNKLSDINLNAAPEEARGGGEFLRSVSATLEITDWSTAIDKVKLGLTTWIRNVGHVIKFDEKHDGSRIVARLQLMRRPTEQEKSLYNRDSIGTWNMVNICFQKEGVVVWKAPPKKNDLGLMFGEAGETLVIVQAFRDKKFYRVVVPSFDLRNPSECSFFFLNSLTQCFSDLEFLANEQTIAAFNKEIRQAKKKKAIDAIEEARNDFRIQMNNLHSREMFYIGQDVDINQVFFLISGKPDFQSRLGFETSLPVQKGDFVCRLMRSGSCATDRPQTNVWYDVLQLLPSTNVLREMYVGQEQLQVCRLKGNLRIDKVPEFLAEGSDASSTTITSIMPRYEHPDITLSSPSYKWNVETILAYVYVLSARNLENVDLIGKSDPYIRIQCGGLIDTSPLVWQDNLDPDFYERFVVPVTIPGNAQLTISVMDKGDILASDVTIGSTTIDLEERWIALRHRSPTMEDVETGVTYGNEFFMQPLRPFPIEIVPLFKGGNTTTSGVATGHLRYMIDMFPDNQDVGEVAIEQLRQQEEFELRLIIWDVSDITIFKLPGFTNNLFVEAVVRMTNSKFETLEQKFKTDIHEFSYRTAAFNWRIIVPVTLPIVSLDIKFSLIHADPLTTNEKIYEAERRTFDDYCRLQLARYRHDDMLLTPVEYIIEFNEPLITPNDYNCLRSACCIPLEKCGCTKNITRGGCGALKAPESLGDQYESDAPMAFDFCGCCLTAKQRRARVQHKKFLNKPAKLRCSFSLLPIEIAKGSPAGQGRDAPQPMAAPGGRIVRGMMFKDPIGYLKIVMGPRTCLIIQIAGIATGALLGLALVVFIIAVIVIAIKI